MNFRDLSKLDLAFALDSTASMGRYINKARDVRKLHNLYFLNLNKII